MHKATFSVFLLILSLDTPVNALQVSLLSDSALKQSTQAQPNPPADNVKVELTDGTPVRLKFVRAVVSSQVIAGDKVPLEVVESVLADKLVAIPQHTSAEAIVTMAQAGRTMARGGNLQLKIENIRLADGEIVPVRAVKDVEGGGRKALMIATLPFWSFDVRGKNATIPAGAEITAYIVGDFPLDASRFQVAVPSPKEKNDPK